MGQLRGRCNSKGNGRALHQHPGWKHRLLGKCNRLPQYWGKRVRIWRVTVQGDNIAMQKIRKELNSMINMEMLLRHFIIVWNTLTSTSNILLLLLDICLSNLPSLPNSVWRTLTLGNMRRAWMILWPMYMWNYIGRLQDSDLLDQGHWKVFP